MLRISRSLINTPYSIEISLILTIDWLYSPELQSLVVGRVKDLGLCYDGNLNTRIHAKDLMRSLQYQSHLIIRLVKDSKLRIVLFRSFVLPKLDYGSSLFSKLSKSTEKKLEQIQYRFLKRSLGLASYRECLKESFLYPLWLRRLAASIQLLDTWKPEPTHTHATRQNRGHSVLFSTIAPLRLKLQIDPSALGTPKIKPICEKIFPHIPDNHKLFINFFKM